MGELVTAETRGAKALTDRQKRLVEALLDNKSDDEAMAAGDYGSRVGFMNALRSPAIQAALLESRRALLGGSMAAKALKAIEGLVTDAGTPAATRLAASKWVLEQAGHGGSTGRDDDVPLHEMTAAQLEAFMARAQAVVDAGGEPPIINVTPRDGAQPDGVGASKLGATST